ncbi:unnamed protein product [Calypogeia fissa]
MTASSRPAWQANSESKTCEKCKRPFTLIVRRHHCRGCGLLVCDKCSEHRIVLPACYEYGPNKQRVCDTCYVTAVTLEYERGLEQGIVVVPDYEAIRGQLLERVRSYLKIQTGWSSEHDFNGVKVSTCSVEGSSVQCIRSRIFIKAPIKKVMEAYGNMEVWKNWNPYVNSRFIEKVDDASKVMGAVYEFPVIDRRDSCFYTTVMDTTYVDPASNKTGLTVAAMSVEHPLCPVEKGVVRSKMLISMSQLEPVEGGIHTNFTSYVHTDPRGLLPPFVVNAFLTRGADHLRGMRNFVETKLQS